MNHALRLGRIGRTRSEIENSLLDSGDVAVHNFEEGAATDRFKSQSNSHREDDKKSTGRISRSGAFWMPHASQYPLWHSLATLFDRPLGCYLLVVWIILVVIDGAIWFMVTVQMIKLKSEDAQHAAMNISIHVLCGLFTYACIYNLPQRFFGLLMLFDKAVGSKQMQHALSKKHAASQFFLHGRRRKHETCDTASIGYHGTNASASCCCSCSTAFFSILTSSSDATTGTLSVLINSQEHCS